MRVMRQSILSSLAVLSFLTITFPLRSMEAVAAQTAYGLATPSHVETPGLSPALSAKPPYECVVNRYVDATHGNDANPGTAELPWATIQNADNGWPNTPVAGECINVAPGTYKFSKSMIVAHGGNSNTPTGYVVYRSIVPQAARIVAADGIMDTANGDMIMLWAPYVIFDGFEIDGAGLTSGHGIDGCANGGQPFNIAHHFMALNNVIHDVGGSGLSTCTADFVAWIHNVVYNTSGTNQWQTSGINVWQPKALAAETYQPTAADVVTFGITIAYNISHNNGEGPAIPAPHTDGNGIIIDTTLGSFECPTCGTPYPGKILVLGNLSHSNGGSGIHVFLSKNVFVYNNTVYNNYRDPLNPGTARGDLSNGGSENVVWYNNLAISVREAGPLGTNRPIMSYPVNGKFEDSGIWKNNLAFGASVVSTPASHVDPGINLIGVDPELGNPAGGNFVPSATSPVIGVGRRTPFSPAGKLVNIGAY